MEFEQTGSMHVQFRELMIRRKIRKRIIHLTENHHLRKRLEEIDTRQRRRRNNRVRKKYIHWMSVKVLTIWRAFTMKDFMYVMSITGVSVKGKTVYFAFPFE